MLGGISNGLAAFIGKVIGKMTGTGVEAKGMKAEKTDGKPEKGAPLGDPGGHLLHGVGYATKDARTQLKNKTEESNVKTFVEQQQPGDPTKPTTTNEATSDKAAPDADRKSELQEKREARDQDVRRDEQKDEARIHGKHETKEQERDQREERQKDRHHQDRDERDEDEKHGHAWAQHEAEEEEDAPPRRGLKSDAGVFNDSDRCKGNLDDGTRCLRKPVKGIGYCREHAVNWRPDLIPKA